MFTAAPEQSWAWWHQFIATFFSVAFAGSVAVWLYCWQTGKASIDRRRALRAAQIIGIFDMWNLLDDNNLQTVKLPDSSEAKVLLTYLQPAIYEESLRSGLFGTAEAMILSRLSTIMHLYNDSVQRLLPILKSIEGTDSNDVDSKRIEEIRDEIDTVLDNRETVVEAGKNLINLWSLKEVRRALAGPNPSQREHSDPRVAYLVEEHLPKILPPSYKAGILAKLDQAHEAFEASDIDTARKLLDEVIEEAQNLRDNKITAESADAFITSAKEARRHIEDEVAKQRS